MELHRLSENEQAFVECFSRFVNGQMGSAAKVGGKFTHHCPPPFTLK